MMSKEARKLALEALENSIDLVEEDYANAVSLYGKYPSRAQRLIGMKTMRDDHRKAITVLREAQAEQPAPAHDMKLNEMWTALAAYQLQADAAGHGKAWAKMCKEKTYADAADAAAAAYDAAYARHAAAYDAADAADAAAANAAADAAYAADDAEKLSQKAIDSIKVLIKPPPPQRKPLTDEEVKKAMMDAKLHYCGEADLLLARAIEAAHGIKEQK